MDRNRDDHGMVLLPSWTRLQVEIKAQENSPKALSNVKGYGFSLWSGSR